jgi:hypothetical protein
MTTSDEHWDVMRHHVEYDPVFPRAASAHGAVQAGAQTDGGQPGGPEGDDAPKPEPGDPGEKGGAGKPADDDEDDDD